MVYRRFLYGPVNIRAKAGTQTACSAVRQDTDSIIDIYPSARIDVVRGRRTPADVLQLDTKLNREDTRDTAVIRDHCHILIGIFLSGKDTRLGIITHTGSSHENIAPSADCDISPFG
ncbi:hypothetical protein PIB30_095841 [Stylosanthes scabra]|uniref:Uncharacterized protein n=1 Tax=Stylosanthes scabra TaxID=79078 RepID=A0ABU6UUR7_9FABA|nr:hypothetical protein [Stylosanthes scabra]